MCPTCHNEGWIDLDDPEDGNIIGCPNPDHDELSEMEDEE